MKFLNKLERKFGKYAISDLTRYIIALYAVGFFFSIAVPGFYREFLSLDASMILRHGQIWRILTFIIEPPSQSPIWVFLALYMYYMIGTNLERVWGAFRFNLYYFTGMLGHVLAALIIYLISGRAYLLNTTYLNFSLFFAFAMTYPNMQFMIMFIIPIKAKYMAYIEVLIFGIQIVGAVRIGDYGSAAAIVISLANAIVFTLASRDYKRMSPREIHRRRAYRQEIQKVHSLTRHKCAVCGRTEQDNEDLQFRFCSKCNGNYEYCEEHLFTHTHVE